MAALDTPWLSSMSRSANNSSDHGNSQYDPPTTAAFSPSSLSGYSVTAKQRSTVIVHKKSPLLVATPPQVTRALAHSHPFLLPLNKLVGLLTWSTNDSWESFLLVAAFWGITLYGDEIICYGGPVLVVTGLILGMYSRRYSPLSSTNTTGEKGHKRSNSQHKSLDEILDTVQEFTTRCNILLDPFLSMTDYLSTQTTATSATTRPALTTLFIRIVVFSPVWILLTFLGVLTSRRVILAMGTIILSWHSRPACIVRVILWRSVFLRRLAALITGLSFANPDFTTSLLRPILPPRRKSQKHQASDLATKHRSPGVRFTFILYENQRRWIGLGWTTSLFSYERGPWTDEHLNSAPSKDEFELPDVEGGIARWRWVDRSSWRIEGDNRSKKTSDQDEGWIYYDNKWNEGRPDDGWGRYTRRRKWYRDAELVEVVTPTVQSEDEEEKVRKAKDYAKSLADSTATLVPVSTTTARESEINAKKRRSGWFARGKSYEGRPRSDSSGTNTAQSAKSEKSTHSRDGPENDVLDRWRDGGQTRMGVGEDVVMGLG